MTICLMLGGALWSSGAVGYVFKIKETQDRVEEDRQERRNLSDKVDKLTISIATITTVLENLGTRVNDHDKATAGIIKQLIEIQERLGNISGRLDVPQRKR